MSKGILEFDRDDYHENLAFIRAFNADDAYSTAFKIRELCFRPETMTYEEFVKETLRIINDNVNLDFYE